MIICAWSKHSDVESFLLNQIGLRPATKMFSATPGQLKEVSTNGQSEVARCGTKETFRSRDQLYSFDTTFFSVFRIKKKWLQKCFTSGEKLVLPAILSSLRVNRPTCYAQCRPIMSKSCTTTGRVTPFGLLWACTERKPILYPNLPYFHLKSSR